MSPSSLAGYARCPPCAGQLHHLWTGHPSSALRPLLYDVSRVDRADDCASLANAYLIMHVPKQLRRSFRIIYYHQKSQQHKRNTPKQTPNDQLSWHFFRHSLTLSWQRYISNIFPISILQFFRNDPSIQNSERSHIKMLEATSYRNAIEWQHNTSERHSFRRKLRTINVMHRRRWKQATTASRAIDCK